MDPRIHKYRRAAELMRAGRFDVALPLEPDDELSELGRSLIDLGDSLRQRFGQLRALAALTEHINSGMLLEEVLEHLFASCREIIPYQRIGLALLEDGDRIVRSRWGHSDNGQLQLRRGFAAPLEGSSLQTIIQTGKPRILNDLPVYLQQHPRSVATRLIVGEGYRSSLTCPLVARNKPIGFLFFSSTAKERYAHVHVDLFMQIAGQIAIIVEKSELYGGLQRAKEQLERRNRFIRQTFGRYLNSQVVDRLLDSPGALALGGDKHQVSILMSDLRGFTPLTERLPAQQVIDLLNEYLSEMVAVVEHHGGTIVEFIGDAILVLFGAPEVRSDDANRALSCALEMQRAMPHINERNERRGLPQLEMGVAVHTGEAIVGNIGSAQRTKYGVVGAAVNAVARLEGYAVGGQILVTTATQRAAAIPLRLGTTVRVSAKGMAQPLTARELLGVEGGPQLPNLDEVAGVHWLARHERLRYRFVDAEHVDDRSQAANVIGVSARRIAVIANRPLRMFSELCCSLVLDASDQESSTASADADNSYAKVIGRLEARGGGAWLLHFTALSPQARRVLEHWIKGAGR